jgi:hypothetical protein
LQSALARAVLVATSPSSLVRLLGQLAVASLWRLETALLVVL